MRSATSRAVALTLRALVLALVLVVAAPLSAQNIDPRGYDNALSPHALVGHHTSSLLRHLAIFTGVSFDYMNDPLVIVADSKTVHRRLVAHRFTIEPFVALGLFNWVEVGLALPLIAYQSGQREDDPAFVRRSGLGDFRLAFKGALVRHEQSGGLGLAWVLDVSFPTGRSDSFMRDRSITATPRLVFDYRIRGFVFGVNIGYRFRRRVEFRDLVIDDEVRVSLGALFPLWRDRVELTAEANVAFGVLAYSALANRSQPLDTPTELLTQLRYRHPSGLVASLGGGVALSPGYAAPDFRLMLRLAYHYERTTPPRKTPKKRPVVTPRPTIPPFVAHRPLTARDFDRIANKTGDRDGDGIPDDKDKCPDAPEDFDGFQDEDGCPDLDNDGDGIPDHKDKCPNEPETFNGSDDDDGCPDKGPALKIEIKGSEIVLGQAVFFRTGSDELDKRSHAILSRLAQLLKARWDIRRLVIEGHTDDVGDPDRNVDLSERRARRVLAYLVTRGIASFRMSSKGFGAKKPVATNTTPEGRAKNRRVVFRIEKRSGGPK